MSRNSGGTYSLPTGNPVVNGTTIDPTVHNNTLSDIASEITNSLDRGGRGAMTAPLPITAGSVGSPGISFDGDSDTGLYRIGSNNLGIAAGSTKALDISASATAVAGALSAATTVTAGTGIVATTTVTAGTSITATAGNITAATGNIVATAGSMSAGTTVTAGTGVTSTTGNIVATAGDVQAASTKDMKYASAQTRYFMMTAENFQSLTSGAVLQVGIVTNRALWGSATGSTTSQNGVARLPPGATITAVEVWVRNVSGGSINIVTPAVLLNVYGSSGDTITQIDAGGTISVANSFNGYKTVTLGAGPYAIPDDGTGVLTIWNTLNQTAGGVSQLSLLGARITYTVTKLRA